MISIRLIHFFPIPFLFGLLILTLAIILCRKRGWLYLFGLVLFGFYLFVVAELVFFPIPIPENWPANLSVRGTIRSVAQTNLIPFNYGPIFSHTASFLPPFRDIVGNILLTIPFGIGISFILRPRWYLVLLAAVAVGLAMEGGQLFLKVILGVYFHSVDITDVLTNAFGVLLGAGFYGIISWMVYQIGKARLGARM